MGEPLKLNLNENPYLPTKEILEKIKAINSSDINRYPNYDKLTKKLASLNNLKEENILLINGIDSGLDLTIRALFPKKEKVSLLVPNFPQIELHLKNNCNKIKEIKYTEKNSEFSISYEKIIDALNISSGIIISNPNNPLGSTIKETTLNEIINYCEINKKYCIIDEAYFGYYNQSAINKIKDTNYLVVMRTFSKYYGMAGLRFGYIATNKILKDKIESKRPLRDINSFAIHCANIILDFPGVIKEINDKILFAKNELYLFLKENKIQYYESNANFILIRTKKSEKLFNELKNRNIFVSNPYNNKNKLLKNTLRITIPIGNDLEELKKEIKEILK